MTADRFRADARRAGTSPAPTVEAAFSFSNMVFIKVCGITNLEDALAAVESGADALGFNFYRRSPRYIEPARAREIVGRVSPEVLCVGVFVNEESETVGRVVAESGVAA